MLPLPRFFSRKAKRAGATQASRKSRHLAIESLQGRQMLSATPLDLGLDADGYSAAEFQSAATDYAQFVSAFDSPDGHSLVESFEYSASSEVSYSNHVAMAR